MAVQDGLPCHEVLEAVRRVFAAEMGRPADWDGLGGYTRQILWGEITMDEMRALLRGSDEYRYGVKIKREAQGVVERIQAFYPQCHIPADSSDKDTAEHMLGEGRWCSRGGCEEDSAAPCEHWPVTAYRQVQAVAWGQANVTDVVGGGPGGGEWEGSPEQKALEKATTLHEDVLRMYTETLGRFPTNQELATTMAKLTNESATKGDLVEELVGQREEPEMAIEEKIEWAHRYIFHAHSACACLVLTE